MFRTLITAGLFALPVAVYATAPSNIIEERDAGFYVGAGVGQTKLHLTSTAFEGSGDTDETGYKVSGGYQFNRFFSLEGSYYNPGTVSESEGGDRLRLTADIFQFSALVTFPIAGNLEAFGRAGVANWHSTISATVDGESGSLKGDGNDFNWGVGLQYGITDRFKLRGEFEQTEIDQDLAGILPVTFRVRFVQLAAFYQF